ncbi:MAG TPA: prenyltransferase/squalene oxidase repeat-containing protein, partial [Planctomycetota bacterium]|nr:prenyltransferase/squalene oxidase repeat-containing protein [Planctomycetota bacterium]
GDAVVAGPPAATLERPRRVGPAPAPAPVAPELFRNRFGAEKEAALDRFGGGVETERAVEAGLAYLAKIQAPDGSWSTGRRESAKYGDTAVGKSALCLLAFLGAGRLPGTDAPHAEVAEKAVSWLLARQDPGTGHFGDSCAYSHGIAAYALAEAYGLTRDARLEAPLKRALEWIERNQNRGRDPRSRGGWGYYAPFRPPEDGFSRTSITVWQVMALESAKLAGLPVRDDVGPRAREFLESNYDEENGYFLYNREPNRLRSSWRTLPASTPGAAFALRLLGVSGDDPRILAALNYVLERAPTRYRRASVDAFVRRAEGNTYFWYYGTLACFLAGGETWDAWNAALKPTLLGAQAADGSFAPIDGYAEHAGDADRHRAYTTALCVLSLEVYYRYFTPLLAGR